MGLSVWMAVFLVLGLLVLHGTLQDSEEEKRARGILGGPSIAGAATLSQETGAGLLLARQVVIPNAPSWEEADGTYADNEFMLMPGSLRGGSPVVSAIAGLQTSVFTYKIEKGDTLAALAVKFSVTPETILQANPGLKRSQLRAGQEISILPVSGILYRMKGAETVEQVAERFQVSLAQVVQFNKSVDLATAGAGTELIIPGAVVASASPKQVHEKAEANAAPKGYFVKPAEGYNWGRLHGHNAVDVAASCGTPVVASAEGIVIPDPAVGVNEGTWNGGYGKFVLIEHPNGVKTRYAHLQEIAVSVGHYVQRGETIGFMGRTGEATGCHVHFEVIGARNPFIK